MSNKDKERINDNQVEENEKEIKEIKKSIKDADKINENEIKKDNENKSKIKKTSNNSEKEESLEAFLSDKKEIKDEKQKIDDAKDKISINIPDLNEFKESNSFSIDVKNIGNIDAYVENVNLTNIKTNIETENINIDMSLIKEDIIKGSESKKLILTITYKGQIIEETPQISFDINYKFNEVVL